ncbi:MAG: ECF transporter S component [Limosilactobacillus sp.]|uniref:ECF transporter S component n=1 Tax=Limosilactobacillus sp. TaxID=2773925 RepID=UPI002707A38F|nr:ECF transporter S component [Limosilactobacillus sp.]
MRKNSMIQKLTLAAMFIALGVVFGRLFLIPLPWTHGNINLCDAAIFVGTMLLGPFYGGVIGGFTGLFLDLISGYAQYAPFSFVAHGLEGLIAGLIIAHLAGKSGKVVGLLVGVVVMVIGYFFTDSILYNWATGSLGIIPNICQGLVGAVVAFVVEATLSKRISLK